MSDERMNRYAEALIGVQWHRVTADAVARAVMAVADQETAELRAEVERLRSLLGEEVEGHDADLLAGLDDEARLEAEVKRLREDYALAAKYRDEYRDDAHDASEALLNMIGRLEAAEAESARLASVVAKVEALLACEVVGCPCGGDRASVPSQDVRAVLADAAPDPTPNTGERIDWSNTVLVLRQLAQTIGGTPKGTVPVAAVVDTLDQVADRLLSGEFPPAASSADKAGER